MTKYVKYLWHVLRHKWYVLWCGVGVNATIAWWWRLLIHDLSKLTIAEWSPYAKRYYSGYALSNTDMVLFDRALLHHYNHNQHHWQYWVLHDNNGTEQAVEMPYLVVLEMVVDWRAAGLAYAGVDDAAEWYTKHREGILLHPNTRLIVEGLLGV
jgi:hypothetical protein